MKKYTLFTFSLFLFTHINAVSDTISYNIHIIDYSLSWTSAVHYYIDDEIKVVEIDNIDKGENILVHRQLFGKEQNKIKAYLNVFMQIEFENEYKSVTGGDRNQKRISIQYGDQKKSIFIVNTYQKDLANFISFLNILLPENRRMKEFIDPNRPTKQKN